MRRAMKKWNTNIDGLDRLLDGGIREGSICILYGQPVYDRKILANELFRNILVSDRGIVYVTSKPRRDFERYLKESGRYSKNGYVFLDILSPGETSEDNNITSFSDYARISSNIVSQMTELARVTSSQVIFFDSLDEMINAIPLTGVFRFLTYLKTKINETDIPSILIGEVGVYDDSARKMISQIANITIEMYPEKNEIKIKEKGRREIKSRYKIVGERIVIEGGDVIRV